jgi:hypothetical protein
MSWSRGKLGLQTVSAPIVALSALIALAFKVTTFDVQEFAVKPNGLARGFAQGSVPGDL